MAVVQCYIKELQKHIIASMRNIIVSSHPSITNVNFNKTRETDNQSHVCAVNYAWSNLTLLVKCIKHGVEEEGKKGECA